MVAEEAEQWPQETQKVTGSGEEQNTSSLWFLVFFVAIPLLQMRLPAGRPASGIL
jgi:hypothetical protein